MGVPSSFSRLSAGPVLDPVPSEPITAAEVKSFLRVTTSADDALIQSLCSRARLIAERLTGRCIIKQSLYAWWDFVPGKRLDWWDGVKEGPIGGERASSVEIPRPPLISVSEVCAFNDDDSQVVLDPSAYFLDITDQDLPGRVVLRLGATWPVFTRNANGFRITFIAGYATVPEDIRHALILIASWLYKNRGDCSDEGCASACGAMMFLRHYVMMKVS